MPATSGDITHIKTIAISVAQLQSFETANFGTGDFAILRRAGLLPVYYSLDKESLAVADGVTVLYTKNALQAANPAATPGRWVLSCFLLTGCTGTTGPTGP